ncbi:hypothetical protein GCM10007877_03250 [Marinibactrum halimedae]|uniref:Uncharacterized protein n=1 Tax=Marinibactrum halimedae TaxID=1444977 RepID=A0AA37T6K1_9GAMM|nr:hypothetical protein GCM10007877_03250 [Marinibactrum halimedae]
MIVSHEVFYERSNSIFDKSKTIEFWDIQPGNKSLALPQLVREQAYSIIHAQTELSKQLKSLMHFLSETYTSD